MTKLQPSYFSHIMKRQESLEKTLMLGKAGSSKKKRKNQHDMDWLNQGRQGPHVAGSEQGC